MNAIEINLLQIPVYNPLEDSTPYTFAAWHGRYDLGNEKEFKTPAELHQFFKKNKKEVISLPVYMMDHGGLSFQTSPFGGPHAAWDSGLVGHIYTTRKKFREEVGFKRITPKIVEQIKDGMRGLLEEYTAYMNGWGWGYELIIDDESDGVVAGFMEKKDAMDQAMAELNGFISKKL